MNPAPTKTSIYPKIGADDLAGVAVALAERYEVLYGEHPLDPRASSTADMVAWVFEDGLGVIDKGMLDRGQARELQDFRDEFFDVAGGELEAMVADLTGVPVTYSFFGFDPTTRTTHGVFVLDLGSPGIEQQRRALIGWSEQVRRNARRVRADHVAAREAGRQVREQIRRNREQVRRIGVRA